MAEDDLYATNTASEFFQTMTETMQMVALEVAEVLARVNDGGDDPDMVDHTNPKDRVVAWLIEKRDQLPAGL